MTLDPVRQIISHNPRFFIFYSRGRKIILHEVPTSHSVANRNYFLQARTEGSMYIRNYHTVKAISWLVLFLQSWG